MYMLRVSVVDNVVEKGIFGTDTVDYFDTYDAAFDAYRDTLDDGWNDYCSCKNGKPDKESIMFVYLYECTMIDHGDHHHLVPADLMDAASVSWYNYDTFRAYHTN